MAGWPGDTAGAPTARCVPRAWGVAAQTALELCQGPSEPRAGTLHRNAPNARQPDGTITGNVRDGSRCPPAAGPFCVGSFGVPALPAAGPQPHSSFTRDPSWRGGVLPPASQRGTAGLLLTCHRHDQRSWSHSSFLAWLLTRKLPEVQHPAHQRPNKGRWVRAGPGVGGGPRGDLPL